MKRWKILDDFPKQKKHITDDEKNITQRQFVTYALKNLIKM